MSGAVGECMQAFVQLCFKNHGDRMATFPAIGVADNSAEEEATAKDLMPVLFGIRETAKVSAWEKHFLQLAAPVRGRPQDYHRTLRRDLQAHFQHPGHVYLD